MRKQTKLIESRYNRYIKSILLKTRNKILDNIKKINTLVDKEKTQIRDSYLTDIFGITEDAKKVNISNKELSNIYNAINENNVKFEEKNTKEKLPLNTSKTKKQKELFIESNRKYIEDANEEFVKNIENEFVTEVKENNEEQKNVAYYVYYEYDKSKKKSEFISENEVLLASALLSKYRLLDVLGSDIYRWRTQRDNRVRSSHDPLDMKYCKLSDTTIYAETLEDAKNEIWIDRNASMVKLNPGEDYRCRCWAEYINLN